MGQNDTFSALLQLRYGSNDISSLSSNTPSNAQVKKTQTKKKTTRKGKVDMLLPAIKKWFMDRGFPYTTHIDKWLYDFGVTSVEHMKLVRTEEWESLLLCQHKVSKSQPNARPYSTITYRSFQVAIEDLKKVKYDATRVVFANDLGSSKYNEKRPVTGSNKRKRVDVSRNINLGACVEENALLKKELTRLRSKIDYLSKDLLCDQQTLSIVIPKLRKKEKEYKELKAETIALRAKCASIDNSNITTSRFASKDQRRLSEQNYPCLLAKIISQQEDLGCKEKQISSTNVELRKLEIQNAKLKEKIATISNEVSSPGKQDNKRRKLIDHSCLENLFRSMVPERRKMMKNNKCETQNMEVVSVEEVSSNPVIELL